MTSTQHLLSHRGLNMHQGNHISCILPGEQTSCPCIVRQMSWLASFKVICKSCGAGLVDTYLHVAIVDARGSSYINITRYQLLSGHMTRVYLFVRAREAKRKPETRCCSWMCVLFIHTHCSVRVEFTNLNASPFMWPTVGLCGAFTVTSGCDFWLQMLHRHWILRRKLGQVDHMA